MGGDQFATLVVVVWFRSVSFVSLFFYASTLLQKQSTSGSCPQSSSNSRQAEHKSTGQERELWGRPVSPKSRAFDWSRHVTVLWNFPNWLAGCLRPELPEFPSGPLISALLSTPQHLLPTADALRCSPSLVPEWPLFFQQSTTANNELYWHFFSDMCFGLVPTERTNRNSWCNEAI